jgi:hypothetical protein
MPPKGLADATSTLTTIIGQMQLLCRGATCFSVHLHLAEPHPHAGLIESWKLGWFSIVGTIFKLVQALANLGASGEYNRQQLVRVLINSCIAAQHVTPIAGVRFRSVNRLRPVRLIASYRSFTSDDLSFFRHYTGCNDVVPARLLRNTRTLTPGIPPPYTICPSRTGMGKTAPRKSHERHLRTRRLPCAPPGPVNCSGREYHRS